MRIPLSVLACLCFVIMGNAQTKKADSLKQVIYHSKEDTNKVKALLFLANILGTDTCLILDGQALSLSKKLGFKRGEASSYRQFYNDYFFTGNYPKALESAFAALKIYESLGNRQAIAGSYQSIGAVYAALGDHRTALQYLYKGIALMPQGGALWNGYRNIGEVYEKMNRLDSALSYYQKSYELVRSNPGNSLLPTILAQLGDVHRKLRNTELAFAYYRSGIAARAKFTEATIEFGMNTYGLAQLFKEQHKTDSAIHYALSALADAKPVNPAMTIKIATLLSELYEPTDPARSLQYYKLAGITKDSTYEAQKLIQVNNMTADEAERQKALAAEEQERKQSLQYVAISFAVIAFMILFFLFSHSIIANQKIIRFLGVIALLIVFEFLNLLLHPWLGEITHHSPLLMLLAMVCVAALLIPLHHKLEHWITHRLVEKNKKIKLAAAKKIIAKLESEPV